MIDEGSNADEIPSASRVSLGGAIFAGKGEMAGLVRATDWSSTPLGPIEGWSQSLRTAVSICLGSRHPIALWWGPERWMFYNDGYRPMLGERHPQFLGRPGQECWADIWNIIGPMMEQVIETGEPTWSEDLFLLMRRSGYLEETYYTFSYSPIRDEKGRPSGIFNACSETTARVLGDRRMKTLRQMAIGAQTVNDAARLCAEVLARNPRDVPFALIYLLDEQGKYVHLAAQAALPWGTPASPLSVAMHETDDVGWPIARVAARGRAELVDDLPRRFDCLPGEPWDEPAHRAMVLPIAHPGGPPAGVVVLGVSPRRAFDDDYRGFFDMVTDHVATAISNARAHEEQRERADKLADLDLAKTAFFGNVSHEFRTPLTLILGPLEDALGDPAKSLAGENLEAVYRSALRLLRLVNNLLDFSRVEAGRLQSRFEPTDLSVLTGGLAGSFQSLLESVGLKLRVECPPLAEPVYVDRSQWEKIVLNLISNAFKFTFTGEIAISLNAVDGNVELSVKDTGTGIAAQELPKIFDRFYRVQGAQGRTFEGTGIGLALVQELVKLHGGSVRVDSAVGQGSTFVVAIPKGSDHLPKDRVASHGALTMQTPGPAPFVLEARQWGMRGGVNPSERGLAGDIACDVSKAPSVVQKFDSRVLVADDNADMREYLVRLLEPRWTVEAVEDGQAALESALERPPDLILTDVMMPRMDGIGLLRALRANLKTSTIPVVLLSARAGEEAMVSGLETGADDYLVKPFSGRELLSRVGTHLEMSRLRRTATEAATELAETRATLLDDLNRKNRELESFSYSVSHDLRAPLRSIDGFSQALLEDYGDQLGAQAQDYLRRVRSAAQRMGELIEDLLEISRVERTELRREPVDVSKLCRRVGDLLAKSDPDRDVGLVVEPGLLAEGDARLLEILVENLLGNAWKFTAKTTVPRVECGSLQRDGHTTFYVKDNGAGFDQAYAERLFTPFQRLHSSADFPGTGIGLATVSRIVDRHAGRVWAEGHVDGGATVYWTLPTPPRRSHVNDDAKKR